MRKILPICIALICISANAKTMTDLSKGFENGRLHVEKYNNPQCRGLRDYLQNTGSTYTRAYEGKISLKVADTFAKSEAIDTIRRLTEQQLPLPFNASFLLEQSSKIQSKIFSNQYPNSDKNLDEIYNKCASALASSAYSNADNYDRAIDYSKGEDKIYRPKITKIEQVCDREDFPALMEKARTNIKEFAYFRKLSTEKFLSKVNYQSINRLAEDMLQAGLDNGLKNDQFLWNVYNAPNRGLKVGHLAPRCKINQ